MDKLKPSFTYKSESYKDEVLNPLVSIVVATYNQENLILETIESVLNQDYSPLEIVITDDCSSDKTYELILERCKLYAKENGSHSIILSKNRENRGIVKNYEQGFMSSHGQLLVTQGGDDLSYPNRVSTIAAYWLSHGRKSGVFFHGLRPIDTDGKHCGYDWWKLTLRNPIGAAMAYTPEIVTQFPAITVENSFEDNIFARRAYLFGNVHYIDPILIDYRVGSGMTSTGDFRTKRLKISHFMCGSTIQNKKDIDYVRGKVSDSKVMELEKLVDEIATTYRLEYDMISSTNIMKQLNSFRKYVECPTRNYPFSKFGVMEIYIPLMFPTLGKITSFLHQKYVKVKGFTKKKK